MKKIILVSILALTATLGFAQPSLQAGLKHLENENYEAALAQFTGVAKADPKNSSIYYYIGQVSYLKEEVAEAEKAYNKGLAINSQCPECKVGLGQLRLDEGNAAAAKEYFESAARLDKKNPETFFLIGKSYLLSKNASADDAVYYLQTARDMNVKDARYWALLGDAYKLKGNNGEAMTNYERAVELDPTISSAYISMARIWSAAKNYDDAIARLLEAIKLAPNDAAPYKDLVELYIRKGEYSKVTPLLEKYTTLIGDDVDTKVRYIKYLTFQAKDYDRAITEGTKLLKSNPEQYTLHRWLAWAYFEKGMHKESYEQSIALFDDLGKGDDRKSFATDYDFWAKAALAIDSLDKAAHIYRKYLELEPTHAHDIYGNLAKAYFDKKDYTQAAAYFARKNGEKELNATDKYYLGLAYFYSQQDTLADSMFAQVLTLSPDFANGHLMRARVGNNLDPERTLFLAKPHYERYIEILSLKEHDKRNDKNLIEAHLYMGPYYVQVDSLDLAIEHYEKVLEIDSTNEKAIEDLKILKGQN